MEQCPFCSKGLPMPTEEEMLSPEELGRWQDIEKRMMEKKPVSGEEKEFYLSRLKVAQAMLLSQKL